MKIRTDFVTNSSSSSFIMVNVKSKKMTELLNKYPTLIPDKESDWISEAVFYPNDDESEFTLTAEECWFEFYMEEDTLESMVDNILDFFDDYLWDGEAKEEMSDFVNTIKENKQEFMEDIEELTIEEANMGWQGDDESRFWQDWYEPEHLDMVLETISEENNCEIEEITGEMFSDYVCCMSSEEVNTTTYKKETGEITRSRTTDLI